MCGTRSAGNERVVQKTGHRDTLWLEMPPKSRAISSYGLLRSSLVFKTRFCKRIALGNCSGLRPWSSWTANSDKKLNIHKPCVTSLEKQPFESFGKFSVNLQDVTSFGKILKKINANFGKILRKEKIL